MASAWDSNPPVAAASPKRNEGIPRIVQPSFALRASEVAETDSSVKWLQRSRNAIQQFPFRPFFPCPQGSKLFPQIADDKCTCARWLHVRDQMGRVRAGAAFHPVWRTRRMTAPKKSLRIV